VSRQVNLPDDYESCGECGFDHDYEYEEAYTWHLANAEGTEQTMAKRQTKEEKLIDNTINAAYGVACNGISINVFDIPKVFAKGKEAYLAGKRGVELQTAIREYVDTIRKN
jgi:hypothetical protein